MVSIWWIRRDLRLTDNPALDAALKGAEQVLPVFILDPTLLHSSYACPNRTAFLLHGLRKLDAVLRERGSSLTVRQGDPVEELIQLCRQSSTTLICAERDVSPYAQERDERVRKEVPAQLYLAEGLTTRPLANVLKNDGTPYTVFTPFCRKVRSLGVLSCSNILASPERLPMPPPLFTMPIPDQPVLAERIPFIAGETEAQRRLFAFAAPNHEHERVEQRKQVKTPEQAPITRYADARNRPDLAGTSQLSPYLRFGMISARSAAVTAYEWMERAEPAGAAENAESWLNELIWRDFYLSILQHFPRVRRSSFRAEYDTIDWENNEQAFAAWCEGRTGYPFIDAAMRQLKEIGWMHNRARMAVASFLVKDLLIDWRWGERWFMQNLIDGDPAANNGGWQWSAGTGTDAAPYFRIFNPIAQGQKFDPEGLYIRRWLPELAQVATKFIHEPWQMPSSEQIKTGCVIGRNYPSPIIDHAFARARVLAAYQNAKGR